MREELPEVLAHGMGNYIYLAKLESKEEMEAFFCYTLEVRKEEPKPESLPEPAKIKETTSETIIEE